MSERTVHPLINLFVRQIEALDLMLQNGEYGPFLNADELLILKLRPEHRDEGLLKKIRDLKGQLNAGRGVNGVEGLAMQFNYARFNRPIYVKIFEETLTLLWSGGYLIEEFYRKAHPTAGDKQSGSKPREGLPEVMSSRLS